MARRRKSRWHRSPLGLGRGPHRLSRSGRDLHRGGAVADHGRRSDSRPGARRGPAIAHRQHRRGAGHRPRWRCRIRVRPDRELDRRVRDAHAGQLGHRFAPASVRRDHPGRRVHHRRQTRPRRRRCAHPGGVSRGGRAGTALGRRPPARRRVAARVLQRRRGAAGGRGPSRRRGDLAPGRHPLGAGRAGRRRGRRTQRPHPLPPGRPAGAAAGPHRCRPDGCGSAHRQRARCVVGRADRIRDPRHRPDPDRIPADPDRAGHLRVLRRLCGPHRRRRRRRGTQGAAPSLCGCAIPGILADGLARRGATAARRRGGALAGAAARRQTRNGAGGIEP